jgi:hypothetical protein
MKRQIVRCNKAFQCGRGSQCIHGEEHSEMTVTTIKELYCYGKFCTSGCGCKKEKAAKCIVVGYRD